MSDAPEDRTRVETPYLQLVMQKLMINQALENMGLRNTQMIATLFDGITRHSPEGTAFKRRAEAVGWKEAVRERDLGTYDWTADRPINRALGRPHLGHTSRSAECFIDELRRGGRPWPAEAARRGLGDPWDLSPLRADIGTSMFPETIEHSGRRK